VTQAAQGPPFATHKLKAACVQAALFLGRFNAESALQAAQSAHFSGVKSKDKRLKRSQ
jgi:hypothetical protein